MFGIFEKRTAIDQLYENWRRMVYSFCLYITGNPDLASRACERAFLDYLRIGFHLAAVDAVCHLLRIAWGSLGELTDPTSAPTAGNLLARAVLKLPVLQRGAFVAHSALGLTHEQTARVLGVAKNEELKLWSESLLFLHRLLPQEFFNRGGHEPTAEK